MEHLLGCCKSPACFKHVTQHTPFVYVAKGDHTKTVEVFPPSTLVSLNTGNRYKAHLFHEHDKTKNCEMVKAFRQYGLDVNMKGSFKKTALHLAAQNGDVEMV